MKSNRRNFLQNVSIGAAGLGLTIAAPLTTLANDTKTPVSEVGDEVLFIGDNIAVVNTTLGKVCKSSA